MSTNRLRDLSLTGKKIIMRVDFNVPLDNQGNIIDDTRISAALPTIRYILSQGASLVLMSHLGRPKERKTAEFSLKPCAERLKILLGQDVPLAPDCVGELVKQQVNNMQPGQVLLLENLRFHAAEEHPSHDDEFVRQLASYGEIYVNDAFGTAHRAHASTYFVPKLFPNRAVAGFLMEKEVAYLGSLIKNPKRPFYAILGGSKISSKCGVIESLLKKADKVFIGGGMTYTFLKAQGIAIGDSIHEDGFLDKARQLLGLSGKNCGRLILPTDLIVANRLEIGASQLHIKCCDGIPSGYQGVDIGPDTVKNYALELKMAATIFWNGPVGVFEIPEFAKGTNAIAQVLAQLPAETIIGGGDSIAAVQAAGVADKMAHLSTGGGASLEFLEFGTLPGIEALSSVV